MAKKKLLIICLSVVLALLLIALAVLLFIGGKLNLIGRVDPSEDTMSPEQASQDIAQNTDPFNPDAVEFDPDNLYTGEVDPSLMYDKDVLNILLIGQDENLGEERSRSDTLILCSLNKKTGELILTSFMRDMYVNIPGYYAHKINSAYKWGGISTIDSTLAQNFGLKIDGNLVVDFTAFEKVVDILGGMDLELTAGEARYINKYAGGTLTEGWNHLNGSEVLMYARTRKIGNADFQRTERQRLVLSNIVEMCRGKSLLELNQLMNTVLPLITTDMSNSQILSYAAVALPMLANIEVKTNRIPADEDYYFGWVSDMSVLVVDFEASRQLLKDTIYGE